MSRHATDTPPIPTRDPEIELAIDLVTLTPEGGPSIDFKMTAKLKAPTGAATGFGVKPNQGASSATAPPNASVRGT